MDEDYYDNGTPLDASDDYGRTTSLVYDQADDDGVLSQTITYSGADDLPKTVYGYENADFTSLLVEYDYDAAGVIVRKKLYGFIASPECDVNNDGIVTPDDVNLLIDHLNTYGSTQTTPETEHLDVNRNGWITPEDTLIVINFLNSGELNGVDIEYVYYGDTGLLKTRTLSASGPDHIIFSEYENQDFYNNGEYGRVTSIKYDQAVDDNVRTQSIVYDNDTGDKMRIVYGYSDNNWTTLVVEYEYSVLDILIRKVDYVAGETYTYYGDTGYLASKAISGGDQYGNEFYYHLNEAFYDNGTPGDTSDDYGRVQVIRRATPTGPNNEIQYSIVYANATSDQERSVYAYSDTGWQNLVNSYHYDAQGRLTRMIDHIKGETYDYYVNSGRMKKKTMSSGAWYEYYNESFYDNGTPGDTSDDYGRLYKQYDPSDGKTFTTTSYYSGTDLKSSVSEQSSYPGTLYYFYDSYTQGGNEVGFRKIESAGDVLEFKLRGGEYHLYKKSYGNSVNWFMWDNHPDFPGKPGWGIMYEPIDWGGAYPYRIVPFNKSSPDPTNPVIDWNTYYLATTPPAGTLPELGAWPPSAVDYPSIADPESLLMADVIAQEDRTSTIPETEAIPEVDMSYFIGGVEELQGLATGEGVTIALLDTGVDAEALGIDLEGNYDFTAGTYEEALSYYGTHGTKTASIIAGAEGVSGIASGADLVSITIFDSEKQTTTTIVADAIRHAVDSGADVITLPFSLYPIHDQVQGAIDYAALNGVILVAAAGNDAMEILDGSLAAQNNIITVGAVDYNGVMSAWSNYGSPLDLLAPWDVVNIEGLGDDEAGTSFSAAFVAGLVSLVLEEVPDATVDEVLYVLDVMLYGAEPISEDAEDTGDETEDEADEAGVDEDTGVGVEAGEEAEDGEDADASEDEQQVIQGADVNEVVSMIDALRKQKSQFTGHGVKSDDMIGAKGWSDTLMPATPFKPMVSVVEKDGKYLVIDDMYVLEGYVDDFKDGADVLFKEYKVSGEEEEKKETEGSEGIQTR